MTEFREAVKGKYRRWQCRTCQNLMMKTMREERALDWPFVKSRREAQKRYRTRNIEKIRKYQREYQRKYREAKKHGKHVDS